MQKACVFLCFALTSAFDLCGCSVTDCDERCVTAQRYCTSNTLITQSVDVLSDPYQRRALSNAAVMRVHAKGSSSKTLKPLWETGRNVTASEPWVLVETWKSESVEVDLKGGLFVSGSDGLAVFDGNWLGTCDRRHVDDCFPLALSPALVGVRRHSVERLVLVGEGPEISTAFVTLAKKLPNVRTVFIEDISTPLPPIDQPICTLFCPTSMANIPVATFEGTQRSPFVGAQYIYVPLPGALERTVWLCALSSVVLIGSWQGKYQLTLS